MKKIITTLFLAIILLFISGCETTKSYEYTIDYYVDGLKLDLKPNGYNEGDEINLPTPKLDSNPNALFDGWYETAKCTGEKVTEISKGTSGDKVYYGKFINNETTEYTIKYYINDKEIEFDLDKYQEGSKEELPFPALIPNEEFKGWYLNSNKEGKEYNSLEGLSGNLTLYGYINGSVIDDKQCLSNAFSYTSYQFDLSYNYSGEQYIENYKVDGSTLKYSYDNYSYLLTEIDGMLYYFFEEDGIDYYLTENDEIFYLYGDVYYTIAFNELDVSMFILQNNYYTVEDEYLDEVGLIFTGYEEDYTSFKLFLDNEKVSKVLLSSIDQYGEAFEYEITFSNFGNISLEYNENAIYYYENSSNAEIEDIYNMAKGDEVTFSGVITGIYGNNFYIHDNTKGILVYMGNNTDYSTLVEVGNVLSVTGTVDIYKNIHQIKEVTSLSYDNNKYIINNETIDDISQETLKTYVGEQLTVNNVTIASLPSSYPTSGSDVSFKISDGKNIVSVFISKHVSSNYKTQLFDLLKSLKVNDEITIDNIYLSYYNEYQLAVNESTVINSSTVTPTPKPEGIDTFRYTSSVAPITTVLDKFGYDEETNETYGITLGLPSIGNPKVLVIPVLFSGETVPNNLVSNLQTAFFGTSEMTGWESLTSYYYKSSYGKLNITGTVLEPYNTGKKTSYYDNLYNQYLEDLDAYYNYETDIYPYSPEYEIIKDALEYYDSQINYADYDSNNDGYIDSIYIVYAYDYNEYDDTLWWAFTNEYLTEDVEYYDNVEADFYTFMSYYFIEDEFYGNNIKFNAETIIHESGHLLGLDDYYDYDNTEGPDGGLGGGDMMDSNVGDNNAYSKAILGWIEPYIVSGKDTNLEIGSFVSTGDAIFVYKNWNGSIFDEFIMIDFYTPTGINEAASGNSGLFSIFGIRIYHVIATLNNPEDCWSIYEMTKYNNSYTDKKLISIIEADFDNTVLKGDYSENDDLFQVGDILSSYKWSDGTSINFSISINNISNDKASITIDYK